MLKKDRERRLLQSNKLYGSVQKTYVVGIRSQDWSEVHTKLDSITAVGSVLSSINTRRNMVHQS